MTEKTETIENASRDDVRPGDHLIWTIITENGGVTLTYRREGIAHDRDDDGDWCTEEGRWITDGEREDTTLTIRRPVKELPTEDGAVIVPADGHEYITVTANGATWYVREAVRAREGLWLGAWRSADRLRCYVATYQITPGTWKVGGQ